MNAIAAIIFIAFVAGGMTVNMLKNKYEPPCSSPPIVQVQSGDSVSDGDTTDGK